MRCSFCGDGRGEGNWNVMVAGQNGAYICCHCADVCAGIIQHARANRANWDWDGRCWLCGEIQPWVDAEEAYVPGQWCHAEHSGYQAGFKAGFGYGWAAWNGWWDKQRFWGVVNAYVSSPPASDGS